MKSYNRLTQEERYYISALKASHLSIRQIAKQLKHDRYTSLPFYLSWSITSFYEKYATLAYEV